ncbi:MAG: MerR family transcriptional regulator [Thermoanaerobaculia bacterium]
MSGPAEKRFKIGEVCRMAGVQPYVLRYWETEFPPLAPGKTGGGQRLYTQREIDVILRIKELLYDEGFTIAGAKKKLEAELDDSGALRPAEPEPVETAAKKKKGGGRGTTGRAAVGKIRRELEEILEMLSR